MPSDTETLKDLIELADQAMAEVNAESSSDVYDRREVLAASRGLLGKMSASAGDAELLAEAANMLEQVIEAAEIAMKDVNAESSSDVWDVNHLLGPARGVLARCRAAHAAENIPATSPTLEMVKQAKEAIEENTRSLKEPQTVEHGWGGTGPKPSAPHAEAQKEQDDE